MSEMQLRCLSCGKLFPSGYVIGEGEVTFLGTLSQCRHCGSIEAVPDGTFRASIEGIISVIQNSSDPVATAQDLIDGLKEAKEKSDDRILKDDRFREFEKWLPDNNGIVRLTILQIYISILQLLIPLLTNSSPPQIIYKQVIHQYDQSINVQIVQSPESK